MKAYNYGRSKEYWVKKFLEERGYIVIRSAGSKGLFDIVAVHPEKGIVRLIQVKAINRRVFSFKETREMEKILFDLAKKNIYHDHIRYEVWIYNREEKRWYIWSNGGINWEIKNGKIQTAFFEFPDIPFD